MISWWVTGSYFNNEPIKIGDIEIMTAVYGSLGSLGSIVSSKFIRNNTYTGRRRNFHSKPTPINISCHRSDLNYSYPRSKFSRLPQAVSRNEFYCLSQKFSYAYNTIDPVINGFITHEVISHLHIYTNSIVTSGIRVLYLGLSNTYNVGSLDRLRKSVVDKAKTEVFIFKNPFKIK